MAGYKGASSESERPGIPGAAHGDSEFTADGRLLASQTPRDDAACAGEEVHHKSNGELSCLTAGDLTKTLGPVASASGKTRPLRLPERCEQNYVRSWLPRKAGTLTDSQHISPMFCLWTVCWLAYNCQLLEPESMKVKAQPLQRHFAWTRLGSRCAIFCQILPSRIGSAYFDMAKFRYLRTFIDEESSHGVVLSRTPSCPNLGVQIADKEEEQWLSDYVTGLEFKSQTLTPVLPAQEIPEEMPVVPEVEGDQVHQLQIQSDADAATLPVGNGSRGHPFLCRRPCVRLAKGNCHMGDACGYCHHQTHHRFASLDKRQRVHLHSMDTGKLAAVLLPHIRRCVADAGVEATAVIEMIEMEADAGYRHRDRFLDRTLRQMPLSALLSCITRDAGDGNDGIFQAHLHEQVEQLRQGLP
eukprot:symbB.v1.2.014189.t1/scaffold1032.1/size142953/7